MSLNTLRGAGLENLRQPLPLLVAAIILAGFYISSLYNFLLFHVLAELFSAVIACGIFMIAWNTRRVLRNQYLMLLGIAYFFVAILGLSHALAYKGMKIFPGDTANVPTQLWVAARMLESLSLLLAPVVLHRQAKAELVFMVYATVTVLLLLSVFVWQIFPDCYDDELQRLTGFKRLSELGVCLVLLGAILLLLRHRRVFDEHVLSWLIWSLVLSIGAELIFSAYSNVRGLTNLVGHFIKIVSFYLVYKAIIETGLTRPYALLLREAKKSEERFRAAVESFPYGLAIYDQERRYRFLNHWGQRLAGKTSAEVLGRRDEDLFAAEVTAGYLPRLKEVLETQAAQSFEWRNSSLPGGRIFMVSYVPLPAKAGEPQQILAAFYDITERKMAQEELERLVRERTVRLQETTDQLNTVVDTIAHDLRAPIRAQYGFANLLVQEYGAALGNQGKQWVSNITEAAVKLDSLVVDLLKYANVLRQKPVLSPVELKGVVEQARAGTAPQVSQFGAILDTASVQGAVLGHEESLQMAVQNLLSNAIKFVPTGQVPRVRLWTENRSDRVRLWVEDNGIGIAPQHRQKLFRVFSRLHHGQEYPGRGIGLALVKQSVERLGGSVGVESELAKGSRFWIELKAAEP